MQSLFQPPPEVIAFLALKKFGYLEVLFLLALIRLVMGAKLSRFFAGLTLITTLTGIVAMFGPALMNIYSGPLYIYAAQITNSVQGLAMPLLASLLFAVSGFLPGRRWAFLDALHFVLFGALAALWWLTQ